MSRLIRQSEAFDFRIAVGFLITARQPLRENWIWFKANNPSQGCGATQGFDASSPVAADIERQARCRNLRQKSEFRLYVLTDQAGGGIVGAKLNAADPRHPRLRRAHYTFHAHCKKLPLTTRYFGRCQVNSGTKPSYSASPDLLHRSSGRRGIRAPICRAPRRTTKRFARSATSYSNLRHDRHRPPCSLQSAPSALWVIQTSFHPVNYPMSVRLSLAWTYLAQALSFMVTFGSTVVVARLVSPRDFGIFAMANAVATIINVFMHFGLAKYLMREADLSRELLRAVFTVNVLMSMVYVIMILIGAVAAGRLFGSAEVGQFLLVFAIFPLIGMMEFLPAALCSRDMRFGVIGALSVVRAVVLAATTLVLAFKGFAYMSFAWAQVLAWLATAVCYNIIVWRPDAWRLRLKGVRSILQFGAQMIGISGVRELGTRAGEMVLGSMLGLTSLGLYTRASSLPMQLYTNIYGAGSNVIFSRLSKDLRESGHFHETYLRFMRLILGLLWPMMFGLAVLAQPIIHILYGSKWQAAATPLSLLTVASAITVAIGMTSELFILRHQTPRQVKIESVRAAAGFLLFVGGALISLPAASAAKVAESLLALILYRRPMVAMVGGPGGALRRVYFEGLALTVAAVLPVFLLMCWTKWSALTSLPAAVACTALGGLLWFAILLQRGHPITAEAARLLRRPSN